MWKSHQIQRRSQFPCNFSSLLTPQPTVFNLLHAFMRRERDTGRRPVWDDKQREICGTSFINTVRLRVYLRERERWGEGWRDIVAITAKLGHICWCCCLHLVLPFLELCCFISSERDAFSISLQNRRTRKSFPFSFYYRFSLPPSPSPSPSPCMMYVYIYSA